MKHPLLRRVALVGVLALLSLAAAGTSLAQDGGAPTPPPPPPPPCVADAATGIACVRLVLYPATLKADLFIGEAPTEQVQQSALYVTFANPTAGQTLGVVVKNIHDGGADEGTLYHYPDIPRTVNAPLAAGQTTTVTLYPVKTYIRGKINARCDVKSVQPGEDVACALSIDGVPQTIPAPVPATPPTPMPDGSMPPAPGPTPTLAAGQTASFVVEPGKHEVKFDLVGANAALWAPASLTKTVTVTAGSFPQAATATFLKAGHLVAKLAQADAGWVGDFYLDGALVAPGVGSIDQWVAANASHKVEVKNIILPASPGIHPYYDGSATAYTTSGNTSSVTVPMNKIPRSMMKTPTKSGGEPEVLMTDTYVAWYPVFAAQTAEQAENGANMFVMLVALDGVIVGDVAPYREAARQTSTPRDCEGEANVPCYFVGWFIPLGRLAAGPHVLRAEAYPTGDIFVGWTTYSGVYFYWDDTFTVNPVGGAPAATAPASPLCDCSSNLYNCSDFPTHAAAQACYQYCIDQGAGDIHQLDSDKDGNVCESLP